MTNPIGRLDGALGAAAEQLTRGQRWTAALGLAFAAVLLVFGLPPRTIVVPSGGAPAAAGAPAPPPGAPRPPPEAAPVAPAPTAELATVIGSAPTTAASLAPPPPLGAALPSAASPPPPGAPAPSAVAPPAPPSTRVVALTAGNPSGLPNRDDATIAAAFFGQSRLSWVAVDAGGAPAAVCASAAAAGTVVVASQTLPAALTDCLHRRGITVLAFDEHGTGAGLLSTRRGDADTLGDLGRWGRSSRRLDGRVGVVADGTRRPELEPALGALRAGGARVVATAWATGDPAGVAAYTTQVEAFTRAGVEEIVLAAPVAVQRDWVQRAGALGTRFRYVVSDVDDGVQAEGYTATFDGALAHTSLRVPWFARDHGPTPQQQRCAELWTSAATPSVLLATEETTVYAWCEEVAALEAAVGRAPLDQVRISSPLTSDVGPLAGSGWGPAQDAVLVWRAACGCWREAAAFGTR